MYLGPKQVHFFSVKTKKGWSALSFLNFASARDIIFCFLPWKIAARVQTKHVSLKVSLHFTTSLAILQNLMKHLYPEVQQSPVHPRPIVQGTLWTSCDVFLTSTTQVSSGRYLSNICTPTIGADSLWYKKLTWKITFLIANLSYVIGLRHWRSNFEEDCRSINHCIGQTYPPFIFWIADIWQ